MTLVVGCSAHGSPGVSTALQLVASQWDDGDLPVIVEADASGGVLAARYELSLTPGFVSLAESLRKVETPALLDHAQRLPSGVGCLPLSPSATAASAQLRSAGPYLGPYLAQSSHPVLLDVGTLLPDGKAIAAVTAAELLLWFVRPTREELLVLRHRLAECPQPENVAIVLIGDTPYNAQQVSEALEAPVLHTLPVDRRGAMAANLGGDDRYLRRSQLTRSCAQLVSAIQAHLAPRATSAPAVNAAVEDAIADPTEAIAPPPPPLPQAPADDPPPAPPMGEDAAPGPLEFSDEEQLDVTPWRPPPDNTDELVVWVNENNN